MKRREKSDQNQEERVMTKTSTVREIWDDISLNVSTFLQVRFPKFANGDHPGAIPPFCSL